MVNHRVGGISFSLARRCKDCFHFTKAAPLSLLFETARMGMLMLGKDGGKGTGMKDALESGIEEASVA